MWKPCYSVIVMGGDPALLGENMFVDAAADGVGYLVLRLAKQNGCRVIASAGTDEKVAWLRTVEANIAFRC
jgi:NADPH-dependent curcumin reductase CurA